MTMLGPSIWFASPPFCAGYAFHVTRSARRSATAWTGFVLSLLEIVFHLVMIVATAMG
ncbi:MAG: hypothetical protein JSS02_01480 [Planctomycetes bacterium]|nr:hypothetical protein [Planctomycetota bacterium]